MSIDCLSQDLCWLLEESNDHNILIYAGEVPNTRTFKAHINILRARSLYFRAVLSSKLLTSSTKKDSNDSMMTEWYQPNISPEIFEILLRYIYSGKINIDESNIEKTLDYLIAADILWLHQLLEFLQTYLIRSHSAWIKANFVKVFHLMQLHPTTFKKLQQFCKMVLSTDSKVLFESPHFTSLTEEAFISLLKKDYLNIKQSFLWSKVIQWGIAQNQQPISPKVSNWSLDDFSNLRITLSKFFPLIKFEEMSFDEFNEKVRPCKAIFPLDFYENLNYRMAALQRNELIASSEQRSSNDEDFLSSPTFPTPTLYSYLQMESTTQSQPLSQSSKTLSMAPQPSKSRFPLSSSQQSKTRSLVHPNKQLQLQLTSPDQQTKTLVISPPLSPKKPLSPSKQSTLSLTPSRSLSPSPQFQSMLPRSMSPPLSPNKPIKSLNQQRSLPSFRSTQSQPTSPTQENSNNYPLIYNNNSNNSSPPKLKINTYPVSSNTNSNKTENNKSDDSSSPIIETFTPMSKKTSFALVSRDNLALISGWIDGLDLSSPDDASYAVTEVPYKFKLLVRGSRHGFSDKIFHKRCDNKGPTITVIKLKGVDGIVIGGYNPVKWQSPLMRKFEKCHHSFVFSLKPNENDRTYATIKAMQDEEMLEDSLACKYNISNRNLIMNTTPLQHNSLFSRATYSKYAVNLCKGTGPAFGTTDLIMKDGEVTFKSDCYSLDLLKKIGGEMDNEDVKSYMIEEYEVYLLLKRR